MFLDNVIFHFYKGVGQPPDRPISPNVVCLLLLFVCCQQVVKLVLEHLWNKSFSWKQRISQEFPIQEYEMEQCV